MVTGLFTIGASLCNCGHGQRLCLVQGSLDGAAEHAQATEESLLFAVRGARLPVEQGDLHFKESILLTDQASTTYLKLTREGTR